MPANFTPVASDTSHQGYMVAPPRMIDTISGALRAAYTSRDYTGRDGDQDDFDALLRQIDAADKETAAS